MNAERQDVESSSTLNWKLIAAAAIAVLAVVFIAQNTERGTIEFLFFDWEVGVWFGLLITFILGLLVGWLLPRVVRRVRSR